MSTPHPAGILTAAPTRFQTLDEWLSWQESLHYPAIALGLDRCRGVAQKLGLLPAPFVVFTVGGTNGKGSSTTLLDLILRRGGYQVGKYTSPHLLRYNERICVNGAEVSDADLCRAFDQVDRARGQVTLTFFEFGTLAALLLFREAGIDVAVMEVGLGGRLDAVNILDADAALITTVDLDHENWLGTDRGNIGVEKAGIFRSGRPAICADPDPPASIANQARLVGATLHQFARDFGFIDHGDTWDWNCHQRAWRGLPRPDTNHISQLQNAAGVLMVLQAVADRCPLDEAAIRSGLRDFTLPGRFQVVPGPIPVILDVAHNPQAARALAANLACMPCRGVTRIVLGMLRDKNHAGFVAALAPAGGCWYAASLGGERGFSGEALARIVQSTGDGVTLSVHADVPSAVRAALAASKAADRVVVTGSFITVGMAMALLEIKSQQGDAENGKAT